MVQRKTKRCDIVVEYSINVSDLKSYCDLLRAGDSVLLSGTVFTSRDAAHKKIVAAMNSGTDTPFDIRDSVVYYAGATPAPNGLPIGSCGPTTSSRMDSFAPALYDLGMTATIGKGPRSAAVCDAIVKNGAVYLCAVGGAGALAASHVTSCEEIAYLELGCESVKKLEFDDFPLIVGIDAHGGNLFE